MHDHHKITLLNDRLLGNLSGGARVRIEGRNETSMADHEELLSAYSSGDIDRVISIIGAGVSPFITDDKGNTLFHLCCTNNTDGLRILQSIPRSILTATTTVPFPINNDGSTPLHLACSNGLIECVQLLLSCSPDIGNAFEYTNNDGLSPLYYASKAGHIDIVRFMGGEQCQNSQ